MGALLGTVLTWFAGFFGATLITKIAGLVVFSGIAQVMVSYLIGQIETMASGAPQEWLAVSNIMGIWDALGIVAGAWALKLTIKNYSVGPGAAITGG